MSISNTSFKESLSVLLIDVTALDLKLLQKMLTEASAKFSLVKTAKSLKETFKTLKESHFDVAILDLILPDSHGIETLVKLNEKFPFLAIVVNTGVYEDDLGIQTMSLGAQDFIVKGKYQAYGLVKSIYYAKERKRIEDELLNAYNRLQETQNQLVQAEKMNVIGQLASGIAHEVKNPLATILFGAAYLNEKNYAQDEKIQLTLKSIIESANRANTIIKDLLDFASISKIHRENVSRNQLIEKSLELIEYAIKKNKIRVVKSFENDLPQLQVDYNRMEQVIVNLVLNAVQAMPNCGTLGLKTSSKTVTKAEYQNNGFFPVGSQIVFVEVEDEGPGIPESKLSKVFDPFYTTKKAMGGVGLGLSVAKNIIEMHAGRINLVNK